MKVDHAGATDAGRRALNEDAFLADETLGLYAVADGMGGAGAGDVAAPLALRRFQQTLLLKPGALQRHAVERSPRERAAVLALLDEAAQEACAAVRALQAELGRRVGATLTAVVVSGDRAFVAHAGDCRVYLLRQKKLHKLTDEHTLFEDVIRSGKMTRDEAEASSYAKHKKTITRGLGIQETVQADTFDLELGPADALLVCTDGLDRVSPEELAGALRLKPAAAAERLVELANERGGTDNATAIVVRTVGAAASRPAVDVSGRIQALQRMPLFAELTYQEIVRVLNATEVREFATGAELLREGEPGDALYVLLAGGVRLYKDRALIAELGPGAPLGEMALVDDAPRSATAVASTPVTALRLGRADFDEILSKEKELAPKLLMAFVRSFTKRLRKTTEDLASTGALEPTRR